MSLKPNLLLVVGISLAVTLAACSTATPLPPASPESSLPTKPSVALPTAIPSQAPAPTQAATQNPAFTPTPSPQPAATLTVTPDTRPDPKYWSSWPVVPTVSGAARAIYERGIKQGNAPHVFSTVGDCQSEPNVFLGIYESDRSPLASDTSSLKDTISYFAGSFSRKSLAVRDGLSAPSALSPLWADKASCQSDENPVQCELRVRKPAILIINLGTNWKKGASADRYEAYLRQIVDMVIANGTLPVLSTKADNVEGDHSLNRATARVAHDDDVPLWNFWRAADSLPNHGLDAGRDNVYLSPQGWDRRSYTALQVLDAIRQALAAPAS